MQNAYSCGCKKEGRKLLLCGVHAAERNLGYALTEVARQERLLAAAKQSAADAAAAKELIAQS